MQTLWSFYLRKHMKRQRPPLLRFRVWRFMFFFFFGGGFDVGLKGFRLGVQCVKTSQLESLFVHLAVARCPNLFWNSCMPPMSIAETLMPATAKQSCMSGFQCGVRKFGLMAASLLFRSSIPGFVCRVEHVVFRKRVSEHKACE